MTELTEQQLAEKLTELQNRDIKLRQQIANKHQTSFNTAYVGTCEDMCPERERCLRLSFQPSVFEPDEYSMVKEYRRAGADQEEPLPHDLRTPQALQRTMNHLIFNLMDDYRSRSAETALEWYDFLWDRLRAVRKDITQQNITSVLTINLVEQCTRFHAHSCYAMNRIKDFDVEMNKKNLNDCLQMLRQMYNDLKIEGICCDDELEYQKYDVLVHLDDDPLSTIIMVKNSGHHSSPAMKYITKIFTAFNTNDYYTFFMLLEKANYIESCILSLYINRMRLTCIKILVASCKSKQVVWYPADIATEVMKFDDLSDLKEFASVLDIEIQEKNSRQYLLLHKDLASTLKLNGTSLPAVKSRRLIEAKGHCQSVGQLVHGQKELVKYQEQQQLQEQEKKLQERLRYEQQERLLKQQQQQQQLYQQQLLLQQQKQQLLEQQQQRQRELDRQRQQQQLLMQQHQLKLQQLQQLQHQQHQQNQINQQNQVQLPEQNQQNLQRQVQLPVHNQQQQPPQIQEEGAVHQLEQQQSESIPEQLPIPEEQQQPQHRLQQQQLLVEKQLSDEHQPLQETQSPSPSPPQLELGLEQQLLQQKHMRTQKRDSSIFLKFPAGRYRVKKIGKIPQSRGLPKKQTFSIPRIKKPTPLKDLETLKKLISDENMMNNSLRSFLQNL